VPVDMRHTTVQWSVPGLVSPESVSSSTPVTGSGMLNHAGAKPQPYPVPVAGA
jgi:hypothetical protein